MRIKYRNCRSKESNHPTCSEYLSIFYIVYYRTSPEELLNRLADIEKQKKESPNEKGKDFSLPTKPKAASKCDTSMKKEKVINSL